jgi:hypothetical protein
LIALFCFVSAVPALFSGFLLVCTVRRIPILPAAAVAPTAVPEFLPALAELARMHHFAHAANLHETIWKQLPVIAENVGKKVGFQSVYCYCTEPYCASCSFANECVVVNPILFAVPPCFLSCRPSSPFWMISWTPSSEASPAATACARRRRGAAPARCATSSALASLPGG